MFISFNSTHLRHSHVYGFNSPNSLNPMYHVCIVSVFKFNREIKSLRLCIDESYLCGFREEILAKSFP